MYNTRVVLWSMISTVLLTVAISLIAAPSDGAGADDRAHPFIEDARANARLGLRFKDSPQWGRTSRRNNVAPADRSLDGPIYNTPVVADDVLYVATFRTLYAIAEGAATRPAGEGSK